MATGVVLVIGSGTFAVYPAFGCRFIAEQLAEHGIAASENRVQRRCQQEQMLVGVGQRARALMSCRPAGA